MRVRPARLQKGDLKPGDALVGYNLIQNVALLLEKDAILDEAYFLDFCTLVNAITLHDRLVTLSSPISSYLQQSRLYQYLIENEILSELSIDYSDFPKNYRLELIKMLTQEEFSDLYPEVKSGDSGYELVSSQSLQYLVDERTSRFEDIAWHHEQLQKQGGSINRKRYAYINKFIERGGEWAPELERYFFEFENLHFYFARTAVYWETAGMLNLSFIPEFSRIPIISRYNAMLRQSTRTFIQNRVDAETRSRLKPMLSLAEPVLTPIPSAALNFLVNYPTSDLGAFKEMRKEFEEDRGQVVKWESELRHANELGVKDAFDTIDEVIKSIAASRDRKGTGGVALSITPGIAQAVGAATGDELSLIPGVASIGLEMAKLIIRWYRRSRLTYFNSARKEAQEVRNHIELMEKAFGTSFTKDQIDRFVKLSDCVDNLILKPK